MKKSNLLLATVFISILPLHLPEAEAQAHGRTETQLSMKVKAPLLCAFEGLVTAAAAIDDALLYPVWSAKGKPEFHWAATKEVVRISFGKSPVLGTSFVEDRFSCRASWGKAYSGKGSKNDGGEPSFHNTLPSTPQVSQKAF